MWIVKGTLLGLAIFIGGGFSYVLIRVGIAFYQAAQAAKAGASQPLTATDIRVVIQNPILWLAFLAAIGVGLWIVRSRVHIAS